MSTDRSSLLLPVLVVLVLGMVTTTTPIGAQSCTVPGTHATIQGAADDPACTGIVLAAQAFQESVVLRRSMILSGPPTGGAVVQGLVLLSGTGTVATLRDLRVENGCRPDGVLVTGNARLIGENLNVERADGLPCPLTADTIFVDNFESGGTSAWSSTTPP